MVVRPRPETCSQGIFTDGAIEAERFELAGVAPVAITVVVIEGEVSINIAWILFTSFESERYITLLP